MIKPDGRCQVHDIPTFLVVGPRRNVRHISVPALYALLFAIVPIGFKVVATVEEVFTIPGKGTSVFSSDSLVKSRAVIESTCQILKFEVKNVRPQTWQKFYGLKGGDKAQSIITAKRLYPNVPITLVKHHNRAEALLIAHWARKQSIWDRA